MNVGKQIHVHTHIIWRKLNFGFTWPKTDVSDSSEKWYFQVSLFMYSAFRVSQSDYLKEKLQRNVFDCQKQWGKTLFSLQYKYKGRVTLQQYRKQQL